MQKAFLFFSALLTIAVLSGCQQSDDSSSSQDPVAEEKTDLELIKERLDEQGLFTRLFNNRVDVEAWLQSVEVFNVDGSYKEPLQSITEEEKLTKTGEEKFKAHIVYLEELMNVVSSQKPVHEAKPKLVD